MPARWRPAFSNVHRTKFEYLVAMRIAAAINKSQRDELEEAGLTLREIDDAVVALRMQLPDGFTTSDVLREAKAARERQ